MTNNKIAKILYQVADLLELTNAVSFEVIAYRNAARKIESLEKNISDIYHEKKTAGLKEIDGIGKTIAENIVEIFTTNKLSKLKKLLTKIPKIMVEINNIPEIGPKTTLKLYHHLKPHSIVDLKKKLLNEKYIKLLDKDGFKEKTIQNILSNLKLKDKNANKIPSAVALPIAKKYLQHINNIKGVLRADIVGSLRRKVDTVKDIDIIATYAAHSLDSPSEADRSWPEKIKIQKIIDEFTNYPDVKSVIAKGTTKASVYSKEGVQVDLEILPQNCYGNLLQHFTGSKRHNIKLRTWAKENGFSVSEHGIKVIINNRVSKVIKCQDEECVYKTLGMQFIPPELRNGDNEIEIALKNGSRNK